MVRTSVLFGHGAIYGYTRRRPRVPTLASPRREQAEAMNTSKQNTANVIMRATERHERDHSDLLCLCTDRLCVLLSEIARLVKQDAGRKP